MRVVISAIIILAAIAAAVFFLYPRGGDAPAPQLSEAPAEQQAEPGDYPPPTFDIVRVDANGVTVAAGRAEPGSVISLLRDGETIAEARADQNGEWVLTLTEPLQPGSAELSLVATTPEGVAVQSEQTVVISVPEAGGAPLIVLGEPGEASRVLQGPLSQAGAGELHLQTVDYGAGGQVIFAGQAEPGTTVRVLANEAELGTAEVNENGQWSLSADVSLPPGVYDLQIEQLDADGNVTAIIVLPFERASQEDINRSGDRVVVQPGNSLWRIARDVYGEGLRYTVIYDANAQQIRDPDLIYPGQVFDVPEGDEDSGE
ncbi:MAG: LysM peptidoglycan-binding domain-containing protein [Euryhalocaulis sp.]|uniref:LysM peptidoglycan-binding domain-containing protein n=1 Tax=Euryhalocaulis sp. TaxID=2744307 RepID=UPI0017C945E9|nr:Ig-like domain-containing protein [Euryhalocaulis sp.]MBA4802116.1 LysM peptidoglycan-binding domain-containing protein [Euryhalocaulis sp.]